MMMQIIHLSFRRFDPSRRPLVESLRAFFIGVLIRVMAYLGFGVLIIGRARTGKTYLMERICSGKVLNSTAKIIASNGSPLSLEMARVPRGGLFAIDEAAYVTQAQFQTLADELRNRRVIYALQRIEDVARSGLNDLLRGKPVLIIELGKRL